MLKSYPKQRTTDTGILQAITKNLPAIWYLVLVLGFGIFQLLGTWSWFLVLEFFFGKPVNSGLNSWFYGLNFLVMLPVLVLGLMIFRNLGYCTGNWFSYFITYGLLYQLPVILIPVVLTPKNILSQPNCAQYKDFVPPPPAKCDCQHLHGVSICRKCPAIFKTPPVLIPSWSEWGVNCV